MKKIILALLVITRLFAAETPSLPPTAPSATLTVPPPPRQLLYTSAKALEREGKFDDAKAVYRMAIHNGATAEALREAFIGLARCEEKQENFWAAFLAIESSFPERDTLLALSPTARHEELMRRINIEMRLAESLTKIGAQLVAGSKNKSGGALTGFGAAAEIYDAVVYNHPQSPAARLALIKRGYCLRQVGDFAAAEKAYRMLINTFPDTPEAAEAKIGLAALLAEKTHEKGGLRGREQAETTDIVRNAKTLTAQRPELQEQVEYAQIAIQENEAAALLQQAKVYRQRGGKKGNHAAVFLLEDLTKRYPNTAAANEAKTYLQP